MRSWLFALFLFVPVVAGPAHAQSFEQSLPVAPGERLRIELARGDVDVFTHEAPEVRLEARASGVGASGVAFLVSHEGREIVLRSRDERWLAWLASGPSVRVRAWVPRHTGLAVETSGRVEARDGAVILTPGEPTAR